MVTTHPQCVQYTSFPAVNWFSFYQLRDHLAQHGIVSLDRFDVMATGASRLREWVVATVRASSLLRFVAQVATPYTLVFGHKRA